MRLVDRTRVYGIDTLLPGVDRETEYTWLTQAVTDPDNIAYRSRARQLAAILSTEQPDILHLHNTRPALEYLWALRLNLISARPTVVLTLHDLFEQPMKMISYFQDYFDHFVGVSNYVCDQISTYGIDEDRISLINTTLDTEQYKQRVARTQKSSYLKQVASKIRLEKKENQQVILMPSRRVAHKGHLDTIKALSLIKEQGYVPTPLLLISGSGLNVTSACVANYEKIIVKKAEELSVADNVVLLPELTEQELSAVYQLSDVVLTPSTQPEGFCLANIEAMLSRVPVITSRLGGPLDYIVHQKNGFFVEPGNVTDIATTLVQIYRRHPSDSFLDNAQSTAEQYSISCVSKQYLDVFKAYVRTTV